MPNREGGYGGYQSSQPQQNRMPRKVNAPGSGKVRRPSRSLCTGQHPARSSGRPIMRSSPTGAARRIPAYVANRACRTGG